MRRCWAGVSVAQALVVRLRARTRCRAVRQQHDGELGSVEALSTTSVRPASCAKASTGGRPGDGPQTTTPCRRRVRRLDGAAAVERLARLWPRRRSRRPERASGPVSAMKSLAKALESPGATRSGRTEDEAPARAGVETRRRAEPRVRRTRARRLSRTKRLRPPDRAGPMLARSLGGDGVGAGPAQSLVKRGLWRASRRSHARAAPRGGGLSRRA